LTWSFLWRQALALVLGSFVLGLALTLLGRAGAIGPDFLFNTMGFFTTSLFVLSAAVSFKLLLSKYEVRAPGTPVEQDRRGR
jgi:hypothetical protein